MSGSKMDAGSVSTLPEEMIIEILTRLAVKSLLRFKSVSKDWCSLITNPEFITAHLHNSTQKPSILLEGFRSEEEESSTLSLLHHRDTSTTFDFLRIPQSLMYDYTFMRNSFLNQEIYPDISFTLLGSTGGLLCSKVCDNLRIDYVLWNPATRNFIYAKRPRQIFKILLDGFGHNSKMNDYMLVKIGRLFQSPNLDAVMDIPFEIEKGDFVLRALVYSWRKHSWRLVYDCRIQSGVFYPRDDQAVSVKGEFYWHLHRPQDIILAFDTDNSVFRWIDFPRWNQYSTPVEVSLISGGIKDSLACSVFPNNGSTSLTIDIWVLDDSGAGVCSGESWTKLLTIPFLGTLHQVFVNV
ncbi:hypothetical protein DKX38_018295 [Salix brachista]|uniref:F-box domain-containing protein n=1 Tax=Salix brachista TaxID=2182728 RepID=A0A5N5KMM4_9ROSI|nr:hypothetical protein DKX38_018295 [Salix brachista]